VRWWPLEDYFAATDLRRYRYPKGVYNLLNGLGSVTGQALADHMDIDKIAFTGYVPSLVLKLHGLSPDSPDSAMLLSQIDGCWKAYRH
jgi:hypothetical protein